LDVQCLLANCLLILLVQDFKLTAEFKPRQSPLNAHEAGAWAWGSGLTNFQAGPKALSSRSLWPGLGWPVEGRQITTLMIAQDISSGSFGFLELGTTPR
jgi:hypothetical protein